MRIGLLLVLLLTVVPAIAKKHTTTTSESTTTLEPTTTLLETTTTTETTSTIETTTTSTTRPTPTTTTTSTTTTTLPGIPCQSQDISVCDDGNPCTLDFCNPLTSRCVYTLLDNTPCADEGVFCTVDVCIGGICQHAAADFRCDLGECVVRACRPDDPQIDSRGCILLSGRQPEGQPCTDDGFTCTDDLCLGGSCLHVPVDSRCESVEACRAAACVPQQPDRDEAGCAAGPPRAEGEQCSEDADPCTTDVCHAGTCSHETAIDAEACFPLQDVFRRAIALGNLTREIRDLLAVASAERFASSLATLDGITSDLDAAAGALAGRETLEPAAVGVGSALGGVDPSERAHVAFTTVLRTPQQVNVFLQSLEQARARAALGRPAARHVRRRGRLLLRSSRLLRLNLRAIGQ
jgi:hypothetical protein